MVIPAILFEARLLKYALESTCSTIVGGGGLLDPRLGMESEGDCRGCGINPYSDSRKQSVLLRSFWTDSRSIGMYNPKI